ncbi:PAS domain-containing protein [Janthinobacterium psychrotolerans]|uniref:PAS domain-containing protein n=1 Tax=Janthinobacterium psychrotolerans TaxID=1747903 RepID=UPI001FE1D148
MQTAASGGWWSSALAWLLTGVIGAVGLLLAQRRRLALEQLALNGANLGLCEWGMPSDLRNFDARAAAMLGHAPDGLVLDRAEWQALMQPDDLAVLDQALAQHLLARSRLAAPCRCRSCSGTPERRLRYHLFIHPRRLCHEQARQTDRQDRPLHPRRRRLGRAAPCGARHAARTRAAGRYRRLAGAKPARRL